MDPLTALAFSEEIPAQAQNGCFQEQTEFDAINNTFDNATRTAARENLRVASERHRAGVIPFSERLDAEIALLRASLDHTHSLAQLRVAEAALLHAVGK